MLNLSSKKSSLIASFSFLIGAVVFTVAFISMYWNILLGVFNKPLLSWMVSHRSQELTYIAKMITTLANPSTFLLIGIAIIVWGLTRKEYYRTALILGTLIFTALVSWSLKNIIMDVRPPLSNMVPLFEMDYSFPSGHTISALVLLLAIGYVSYSRNFSKEKFYGWISGALLGASVIALTRLYLGYHWLTDVIASFGLGFIILAILVMTDRFICNKYPNLK